MGWHRKQAEKNWDRKNRKNPAKGEKDWTREQKDAIRDFQRRYNDNGQRKAG